MSDPQNYDGETEFPAAHGLQFSISKADHASRGEKNDASLTLLDDLCKSDKHLNLQSLFKSDHGSPNISLV